MALPLIAGATVYALGWIYLPDLPFFRRWVDRRRDAAKQAADGQKVAEFVRLCGRGPLGPRLVTVIEVNGKTKTMFSRGN